MCSIKFPYTLPSSRRKMVMGLVFVEIFIQIYSQILSMLEEPYFFQALSMITLRIIFLTLSININTMMDTMINELFNELRNHRTTKKSKIDD